jgi:Dihydroorotate dehydrogenase
MAMDVKEKRPAFQRVLAGLSGPAVFPLALRTVWQAAGAVSIPIVGCGGVAGWEDAVAMILAGASAVEVGSALFTDFDLPRKITEGLAGLPGGRRTGGAGKPRGSRTEIERTTGGRTWAQD